MMATKSERTTNATWTEDPRYAIMYYRVADVQLYQEDKYNFGGSVCRPNPTLEKPIAKIVRF